MLVCWTRLGKLGTEEFVGTVGSARKLSVGREEKEMSVTTKLEKKDGGLRKAAGMWRVGLIGGVRRNGRICKR